MAGGFLTRRPLAWALLAAALAACACGPSGDVADTADQSTAFEARDRSYDLQGHRGARGLRPENTLPAFELALDLMVDTLEMDLHLTADDVVVVWHDPVVRPEFCDVSTPLRIREVTAEQLRSIQCDRNPDPARFPEQAADAGALSGTDYGVVALVDVFAFTEAYASSDAKTEQQRRNATNVRFNIETKRRPDDPSAIGDGFDGIEPGLFEQAVLAAVEGAGVIERVTVQSFDHRSIWSIAGSDPEVQLAALTRQGDTVDLQQLAAQGATVWSPDYRGLDRDSVGAAHDAGLLVIPWTVNDPGNMVRLLDLGVDGIITDRPDLAP